MQSVAMVLGECDVLCASLVAFSRVKIADKSAPVQKLAAAVRAIFWQCKTGRSGGPAESELVEYTGYGRQALAYLVMSECEH